MRGKPSARSTSRGVDTTPCTTIKRLALLAACASLLAAAPARLRAQQAAAVGGHHAAPQRYTHEGVLVEFTMEPVARLKGDDVMEGAEATVRFKITDANEGRALTNLRPAAWITLREQGRARDAKACREKVQSFLQASFSDRPDVDLNAYFILALNREPNISVIDPLSGFGTTKLYTLVALDSPGEDWVLSGDKRRLYVSMPLAGRVAVVDAVTWKVLASVEAGPRPTRLALQHDGKYLWAANDGPEGGGVTVIETSALKTAARIETGAGPHEIAFAEDDRHAFVTNKRGGTLSVIDVRRLAKVKDLKTGASPSALAFSSLGKAAYVADEADGTITAVDASSLEVSARMKSRPGLRALRFLPGGRFGFVVNRAADAVYIFDAATNRLIQSVPVGPSPDQINFTKDFAYVRSSRSEFVTMINIRDLGQEGYRAAVNRFPAGQKSPGESPSSSLADAVVPAPEAGAVLVSNPADKMIYFYTEGMAAPMGSFQNYKREPRAVLVLDNSLGETSPGVYTTTVRLNRAGQYDVAFLLDAPRMVNCFGVTVKENPELPRAKGVAIKVEPLSKDDTLRAGESYRLRFRVTDAANGQPSANLKDMGVLVFLAPGIWQQREWAKPLGDGLYEVTFVPPQAGAYYVHFQCPSLGVQFNQIPFLVLRAEAGATATPAAKESRP